MADRIDPVIHIVKGERREKIAHLIEFIKKEIDEEGASLAKDNIVDFIDLDDELRSQLMALSCSITDLNYWARERGDAILVTEIETGYETRHQSSNLHEALKERLSDIGEVDF